MFQYRPEKASKKKAYRPAPMGQRQKRALKHIEAGLAPANPTVIDEITERAQSGSYTGKDFLVDISKDPGCLIHSLKAIPALVENAEHGINLFEFLEGITPEQLQSLLKTLQKNSFHHYFDSISISQGRELQFSMASSLAAVSTAQTVSDLSSEHCGVGAVFRHLGRYLVAWNYPRTFAQVQKLQQERGIPIDVSIKDQLGISPLDIMMHIAGEWNFDGSLRNYCKPLPVTTEEIEQPLESVLFIAELFAQTKDTELYPHSEPAWEENAGFIEKYLSSEALKALELEFSSRIRSLSKSATKKLHLPFVRAEKRKSLLNRSPEVQLPNQGLSVLPDNLLQNYLKVYEELSSQELPLMAIRFLVEEAIPASGFSRGCVFLLSSKDYILAPSLRIGRLPLSSYSGLINSNSIGVKDSIGSTVPLITTASGVLNDNSERTLVVGALQNSLHPGVLYLEADDPENFVIEPRTLFHCIRTTMNDCFNKSKK